jgi:hypothetical protein
MIITSRALSKVLTPATFTERVDEMYAQARWNLTGYGHSAETLVLLNGKGWEYLTANGGPEPFSRHPEVVHGMIRQYHATAAIHVCEAWLSWQSGEPEIDRIPPQSRPDWEEVLAVVAVWPLMKISSLRYASVVRSAERVEVAELDLSGATEALQGRHGAVTSASWLTELLPRH